MPFLPARVADDGWFQMAIPSGANGFRATFYDDPAGVVDVPTTPGTQARVFCGRAILVIQPAIVWPAPSDATGGPQSGGL